MFFSGFSGVIRGIIIRVSGVQVRNLQRRGRFLFHLALPGEIGAKVTWHAKYVTFQLVDMAITRKFFAAILDRIEQLALPPADIPSRILA